MRYLASRFSNLHANNIPFRQDLIINRGLVEEMRTSVQASVRSLLSFDIAVILHAFKLKPTKGEAFPQSIHSLCQLITFGTVPGMMLYKAALLQNTFMVWIYDGIFANACAILLA